MHTFQFGQKITLDENERGISPKTLQRWRCEGRGPKYFKLSKRVAYPIDEVLTFEFEALHESTDGVTCDPDQFRSPGFFVCERNCRKD